VVVMLVAIFLLFVVGAMAALAIDLVTIYTARSEAQQVADAAALAGARVLANSGMTSSDPTDTMLASNAEDLATTVATQVANQNKIAGSAATVAISYNTGALDFQRNPHITVQVTKTDLPTYFSRIWGNTAAGVKATATAEAYNPSGLNSALGAAPPVAPSCVKPWLLPNLDPTVASPGGPPIFNKTTGAIANPGLLGWNAPKVPGSPTGLKSDCPGGDCGGAGPLPPPASWKYYPSDQISFPAPTQAVASCTTIPTPTAYQQSIAGCVPTPIACGSIVNIDPGNHPNHAKNAADAVNCLTHATANLGDGDVADPFPTISPAPFTFIGGNKNPIASVQGKQILVSDSLVTVPVIDDTAITSGSTTATVIGFVQLFLNADGAPTTNSVDVDYPIQTKIVNIIGCGTNVSPTAQPILGNGSSPVAVRLIAP